MRRAKFAWALASGSVLACGGAAIVWACQGTPKPNCFQTAWIAKFPPAVVVLPPGGGPIAVPIGILPFVSWNTNPLCAQPSGASITLTFTCTPAGGGAAIVIGPTTFIAATPAVPGAQPVPGGAVTFTIAAGTLTPGTPYVCVVTGTYTVTFVGGTGTTAGAGTIIGTGDTEVCIVPPSPDDETIPQLNMSLLEAGDEGYQSCRKGDQTFVYYLVENNDSTQSVTLDFSATTNQVARMPGGDTGTDADPTRYAISNPTAGTDNFPQALDVTDGSLIDLANPEDVDDQEVATTLTLASNEMAIIAVAMRSHGMCADGSCSEGLAKVTGTWADGATALGCAGTALFVDDVPAKSHLCEVTDTLQTSDTVDTQWSAAIFDGNDHLSTHSAGNLTQGDPGTQTTGSVLAELFQVEGFPPTASEFIRTDVPPTSVVYSLQAFPQDLDFAQQTNNVIIQNLPATGTVRVPLIHVAAGAANLDVTIDLASDTIVVANTGQTGNPVSFSELPGSLPADFVMDQSTYREIECSGIPTAPLLAANPPSVARLYDGAVAASDLQIEIEVKDPRDDTPLAWTATSDTAGVTVVNASGTAGEMLMLQVDLDMLAIAPETTTAGVTIESSGALNSPIFLPLAFRKTTTATGGGGGTGVAPECGIGLCGMGVTSMMPYMFLGLATMKIGVARQRRRRRQ